MTDWLTRREGSSQSSFCIKKSEKKKKNARLKLNWVNISGSKIQFCCFVLFFVGFTFWLQLTIVVAAVATVIVVVVCLFNTFTYVDISILLCFVVAPPLVGVCLLWLCLALFGFTLFSYLNASYPKKKTENISNNFENVIRNSALRRTFCNVQVEFSVLCPHCWNVHK